MHSNQYRRHSDFRYPALKIKSVISTTIGRRNPSQRNDLPEIPRFARNDIWSIPLFEVVPASATSSKNVAICSNVNYDPAQWILDAALMPF